MGKVYKISDYRKKGQDANNVLDQFDKLRDELVEKLEGGEPDANLAQDSSRDSDNLHSGSVVDMLSKWSFQVCR